MSPQFLGLAVLIHSNEKFGCAWLKKVWRVCVCIRKVAGAVPPQPALILQSLEGHRRHRLFDQFGQEIQRFHDEVSEAAEQVLDLLGIDRKAYGLD